MRQQGVLLGLVEAMDLVDEQDGLTPVEAQTIARFGHDRPHLRDAAHDRRDGHELSADGLGENPGQAGLAASGRSPEQERAEVAAFEGAAQSPSLADQRFVANDLVQGPGAHPGGQGLATGGRHEGRLLLALAHGGFAGDAARCHVAMLQAGWPWG